MGNDAVRYLLLIVSNGFPVILASQENINTGIVTEFAVMISCYHNI